MKIGTRWAALAVALVLPAGRAVGADAVLKSTAEQQSSVEVTVYNDNLGLVKEVRKVELPEGTGELRFMDVPSSIMPVTVHAESLNQPAAFGVLEQNYEYDLMSPAKLLDKYVGKKVKLVEWKQYQDRKDVVEATLLSNNNGPIYQVGGEIYLGHPGYQVLPEIPENLIAQPTLTWTYANDAQAPHKLEVSYLTGQISWAADYVLVLDAQDRAGDLAGWVTVSNQSGATYKDAKLKLVAGQIHRAADRNAQRWEGEERMMAKSAAADVNFVEQGFFEYHIYNLQRPTTVKDMETKQIGLLEAEGAGMQKEFLVYGLQNYYTYRFEQRIEKQPVKVYVKFKNSKENHLGMPLPAGTVRVYKRDGSGQLQLIGEDRVDHTPKDEEVTLEIGEAFDIVADRLQTDYKQVTSGLHESEWEITLRNHKQEPVTVGLVEPVFGNWKVLESSHPYVKADAHTLRFDVPVPKDGEVKVRYRVQVGL